MNKVALAVKEVAVGRIQLLLKKLSDYALSVWQSANSGGLIISIQSNSSSSISYFNSLTALLPAVGAGLLLGLVLGIVVVGFMVLYLFIRYNLFFKKKIMPNGSWEDFQRYQQNPKQFIIKTRGGDISSDDIQTAIDVINEGLGIEQIAQAIKRQCFEKPGFYLMNKRWSSKVLKRLRRLGLITKVALKNSSTNINFISVDAFLSSASAMSFTLVKVPYISTNVTLTFVEFSKLKLLFNIFILGGASLGSTFVVFNLVLRTSVWFLPLISSIPGYALIPSVTSSAKPLMVLAGTYYSGHFLLWPNCDNFAQRIEGVTVDSDGRVSFPSSSLKLISDEPTIIEVPPSRNGATIHDDFVDKVPTSQTMQGSILNNDSSINKSLTLGDLESSPNLRGTGTRKPNQQVQTFNNIAEQTRLETNDFIDVTPEPGTCPMQSSAPVYERIRTEVDQLANGDIL